MLDFIVLGQVPGTQIYLSFTSTLLLNSLLALLTIYVFAMPYLRSQQRNQKPDQKNIADIAL